MLFSHLFAVATIRARFSVVIPRVGKKGWNEELGTRIVFCRSKFALARSLVVFFIISYSDQLELLLIRNEL